MMLMHLCSPLNIAIWRKKQKIRTTKTELFGWYLYDVANAGFFYGTASFISVYILDQARNVAKRTWCEKQFSLHPGNDDYEHCFESYWASQYETKGTCIGYTDFSTNSSCLENGGKWNAMWIKNAALIKLFGIQMHFYSTFSSAMTISIMFQLILLVLFGALADYGNLRKNLFTGTNIIVSVALFCIYFGGADSAYEYNAAMVIIIQTGLNFATVFYNAWLPLLVDSHPLVLDTNTSTLKEKFELRNQVTVNISQAGTVAGLGGAIVFLLISMFLFLFAAPIISENLTIRIICILCAFWILSFSLATTFMVNSRPGPRLPAKNILMIGISRMYQTVLRIKKIKNLSIYLGSYFVWSDGLSTMAGAFAVFASEELDLNFTGLIIAYIEAAIFSLFSSLIFVWLQDKYSWSSKGILVGNLIILLLIPIYAMLALKTIPELYVIVAIYGAMYGSTITFGRSIFSSMIPKGHESEFFSFYQLTNKGTAWLGPLVFSITSTATGSVRSAFFTLAIFFFFGIIILIVFDHAKGDDERKNFEHSELKKETIEESATEEEKESLL